MLLRFSSLHLLGVIAAFRLAVPVQSITGDSGCGYFLCVNATLNEDVVTCECLKFLTAPKSLIIPEDELTVLNNKRLGWVGM